MNPRNLRVAGSFALLLATTFSAATAYAFSGAGAGSSGSPFVITTCSQFLEITNASSSHYSLANNIDCSGTAFTAALVDTFTGSFEGNLHKITGVVINDTDLSDSGVGLFGTANSSAVIQDLVIENASVTAAGGEVGILLGQAQSVTISNVLVSGSVSAQLNDVGGLLGEADSSVAISDCVSLATVISTIGGAAGGLVGFLSHSSSITDSYASGAVSGAGIDVGGLVGSANAVTSVTISNSYASGAVTGAFSVGGFIGFAHSITINDSFATGFVTLSGSDSGGLVGQGLTNSYTNDFFDQTGTGQAHCEEGGDVSGCTGENISNSTPNYFLGNHTSAPMISWDFTTLWMNVISQTPQLQEFPVTPTPTATPTATNTPTATATRTPTLTNTPTAIATGTATAAPTLTPPAASTPTPLSTPTIIPTATPIGAKLKRAPNPNASAHGGSIVIKIKDTVKDERGYFAVIINTATEKLYKKIRIKVSRGSGQIKIAHVLPGLYRVYTLVETSQKKLVHSANKLVRVGS